MRFISNRGEKMGYLSDISARLGISMTLFVIILVWSLVWKLLALWKSARKRHVIWFIVLAFVNTVGILEILYIYVFSEFKKKIKSEPVKKKRKIRKKR